MVGLFGMKILERSYELKKEIVRLLTPVLGHYVFPGGNKEQAVALLKGNETYPQKGVSMEGLECVIFYPEVQPNPLFHAHFNRLLWTIHLRQWDISSDLVRPLELLSKSTLFKINSTLFIPKKASLNIPMGYRLTVIDYA